MDFSSSITVPQHRPDQHRALWEQLLQDGFSQDEIKLPPIESEHFVRLAEDANAYAEEISRQCSTHWDVRSERWLNRLSTTITGRLYRELPIIKRRAICHVAAALSAHPELLP